jgi:hypothetical protein
MIFLACENLSGTDASTMVLIIAAGAPIVAEMKDLGPRVAQ